MQHRNGFSLVELSIVLVILGLLVGGILAGQSLIRAAELRAVSAEYSRYTTAVHAFRDKYFAIPGDFANAQAFWGQSTLCSGAAATGTCNGNGGGTINDSAAASATGEMFQFWRHLALAGLIEGNYSGAAGATAVWHSVFGTNVPGSKIGGAGWGVRNIGTYGDSATYNLAYNNYFMFGASQAGVYLPAGVILKPEEAWNIDVKQDDGIPGRGKTVTYPWGSNCTLATSQTNYDAAYALGQTGQTCAFYFPNAF